MRAEPAAGDIAIGGATLASEAAELGLIDEYPALTLGKERNATADQHRVDLELIESGLPPLRVAR